MKKILTVGIYLLLFSVKGNAQCESWQWGDNFGGLNPNENFRSHVAVDDYGNVFIASVFQSDSIRIGNTTFYDNDTSNWKEDGILAYYNDSGAVIMATQVWGIYEQRLHDVAYTKGYGPVVVGEGVGPIRYGNNDSLVFSPYGGYGFFVIQYDGGGNAYWAKGPTIANGGGNSEAIGVATDLLSNIYVVGDFSDDTLIVDSDTIFHMGTTGTKQIFLMKLDAAGNVAWLVNTGLDKAEWMDIAVDEIGRPVFYTGIVNTTPVTFGSLVISTPYPGTSDLLVMKLTTSGEPIWYYSAGGNGTEMTGDISIAPSGDIYFVGATTSASITFGSTTVNNLSGMEMYFTSLSSSGIVNWTKIPTGLAIRFATSVDVDDDNDIYIGGIYGVNGFSFDTVSIPIPPSNLGSFVAKFDQNGNALWGQSIYSMDTAMINDLVIDRQSHKIYVAGEFRGDTLFIDNLHLASSHYGTYESFVARLNDNISADGSVVDATCGNADGSATITVLGGASPFSYSWSTGDTTNVADSLTSGIYYGTVTDARGCSIFGSIPVSDSDGPWDISGVTIDEGCNGLLPGAIDITVNSGTPPYTFLWSNGAQTEDISGLASGPYDILVTDANGCKGATDFHIEESSPLLATYEVSQPDCGLNNGSATVQVAGGYTPISYNWPSGNTTYYETGLSAGIYEVTVSDSIGCTSTVNVEVNDLNGPVIIADSIRGATCGNSDGVVYTSVTGTPNFNYSWSNGAFLPNLSLVTAGQYTVTVQDFNNCKGTMTVEVPQIPPVQPAICLVTVDTATNTNVVVWDKGAPGTIVAFDVYRETSAQGIYSLVGTVPYDSLSHFVDSVADPAVRSWRYQISSVDSCGFTSQPSDAHKTMHVTMNLGVGGTVNLIWDHYEGFAYATYYINRWSSVNGWQLLDSVTSAATSYTDQTPPAGLLYYTVEARPSSPCVANRSVSYNSSRSNRSQSANFQGLDDVRGLLNLSAYPNPASEQVNIVVRGLPSQTISINLVDITGRSVRRIYKGKFSGYLSKKLSVSDISSGVYMMVVQTGGLHWTRPVVIR